MVDDAVPSAAAAPVFDDRFGDRDREGDRDRGCVGVCDTEGSLTEPSSLVALSPASEDITNMSVPDAAHTTWGQTDDRFTQQEMKQRGKEQRGKG